MLSVLTRFQLAGALGNTVEWFDFAVYGYFASDIGSQFFPGDSPSLQLISAFGVFAVGYLMRPIGGLILGPIGDLIGRRSLLVTSVALMSACSLGIAVLPPVSDWGMASAVILVLLRMLQGLSVGGEFTGSVVALVEDVPASRRGWSGSLSGAGAILGFVGGSSAAAIIHWLIDPVAVHQWGWRIPFVFGAALGLIALGLRRSFVDVEKDLEHGTLQSHYQGLVVNLPAMFRAMGAVALSTVTFYLVTVFDVEILASRMPENAASINAITTVNQAIGIGFILLGGVLADHQRKGALAQKLNLILAALVVPGMLLAGSGSLVCFAIGQLMVLVPMMLYLGVYPSLLPYLFPQKIRCSAFSLSYSISVAVVGGTAPMAAAWMLQEQGWSQGPAWYCVAWSIPALLSLRHIDSYCVDD